MPVCLCVFVERRSHHAAVLSTTLPVQSHAAAAVNDDDAHKKIDWHDYTQIAHDEQRTGTHTPLSISIFIIIISVQYVGLKIASVIQFKATVNPKNNSV